MKKISLISSCYNEEENLDTLYDRVVKAIEPYSNNYEFEYILLDNGSSDNTEGKLRELAQKDKRIKSHPQRKKFRPYTLTLLRHGAVQRGCYYLPCLRPSRPAGALLVIL